MKVNEHYLNRYNKFITHYKKQEVVEQYREKHHIIPKCLNGSDDADNLVYLSARSHFIAHYLLHKAYEDNRRLSHAFAMMIVNNDTQRRECNSRLYNEARKARSKALKNIPRSEEVKVKLRVPKKNTKNYKKKKSAEHANNISIALKQHKRTEEHNQKIADAVRIIKKQQRERTVEKIEEYRNLFIESDMTRKEFAIEHNLSDNQIRVYLKNLKTEDRIELSKSTRNDAFIKKAISIYEDYLQSNVSQTQYAKDRNIARNCLTHYKKIYQEHIR